MSGARAQAPTPAPVPPARIGASVDEAADNLVEILNREDGQSGSRPARRAPARPDASRTRQADPPEEAEPTPDEAPEETGEGDEPEPDETGEGAEEATDLEEEQSEEEQPSGRRFTVKVDGKDTQVDEKELINGYLRQTDYTRKTMAHAEEVKAFTGHQQAVITERQQYAQLLPELVRHIETLMNPPIDWDKLRQENLPAYIEQREHQQALAQHRDLALKEQARLQVEAEREARAERLRTLQSEKQALEQAMPAWRGEQWDKARVDVRRYLTEQGYSDEQISGLTDHKAVIIAWKAAQYDAMVKRGKAVAAAPRQPAAAPPSTPGPNVTRRPTVSQHTRNKQRLAKTHDLRDAAAVIAGLL